MERSPVRNLGRFVPVVLLAGLAGGCGMQASQQSNGRAPTETRPADPSFASPATSLSTDGQVSWDQTVAAAKQEGKLAVVTQASDPYRQHFAIFEKKYGIPLEVRTGSGGPEILPVVSRERQAGQFLWDVNVISQVTQFNALKPIGALDPVRAVLVLPEVLDNSKWLGGFDGGWADSDKAFSYMFVAYQNKGVHINRQIIPESQLSQLDQLWDPQWKGKIAIADPRTPSASTNALATWLAVKGEERVRAFLRDQQVTITSNRRQMFDWVLRGQYPIGIGLSNDLFVDFANQGANVSVIKPFFTDDPGTTSLSHSNGSLSLFNRAPHPNAAKLFANWLLTQESQNSYAQLTGYNSRRTDVPPINPEQALDPKRRYIEVASEEALPITNKVIEMAKEYLS